MKTLKARKNQNNEQLPIENGKRTFRLSIIFAITVIGLMVLRAILQTWLCQIMLVLGSSHLLCR